MSAVLGSSVAFCLLTLPQTFNDESHLLSGWLAVKLGNFGGRSEQYLTVDAN